MTGRRPVSLALLFSLLGLSAAIALWPAAPFRALPRAEAQAAENIVYYGAQFNEDSFVWCLDISGSMSWNGEIDTLRAETSQALNQLHTNQFFSLTAFSTNQQTFSIIPLRAIIQNQMSATAWLETLNAAGWTCLEPALVQSLNIVNLAPGPRKAILLVADGEPICLGVDTRAQVLGSVAAANWQNVAIHVIYLAADAGGMNFYEQLATLNHGRFIPVFGNPPPPPPPPPEPVFVRGDVDGDGVVTGLVDAVYLLRYQFVPGSPPPPCFDAADANDDGSLVVWVEDAVFILGYQFSPGHPPLPPPGAKQCGIDETHDIVGCHEPPPCP